MNSQLEEIASLYVLDKLSEDERLVFEQHLKSDADLVLLVRELEQALEAQVRSLPQQEVPRTALTHILARIRADNEPVQATGVLISWPTLIGWGVAALLVIGLSVTALFTAQKAATQPVLLVVGMDTQSSVVETVPRVMPVDEMENFVQLAEMAESLWNNPEQLPDNVGRSPLANTLGSGYAVFDPRSKHGFIAIHKLRTQKAGKSYFLWLRDSNSNILECAGSIPLEGRGEGLYFFELDSDSPITSNRVAFFITEEDAEGVSPMAPRGEMVLGSDHI